MKVLILTLYSGENEYLECKASVKAQAHQHIDHICFEELPNKEAHDALYSAIMIKSREFDIFVKLDADMVLESPLAITKIVRRFQENPALDMLSLTVKDYFTDSRIWGINCFSNRCKWEKSEEKLFVDHAPVFSGGKIKFVDHEDLVSHGKNPSPYQAFMFGFHRALKIIQKDRKIPLLGHAYIQFKTLAKLTRHCRDSKDPALLYAVQGAVYGLTGEKNRCEVKSNFEREFAAHAMPSADSDRNLRKISVFNMIRYIGIYRFSASIIYYLLRKIKV